MNKCGEHQMEKDAIFTLGFASGYETEITITRDAAMHHEWWVEFTQHQNPYDLADEPAAVDGIALDADGAWMAAVERKLADAWELTVDQLAS